MLFFKKFPQFSPITENPFLLPHPSLGAVLLFCADTSLCPNRGAAGGALSPLFLIGAIGNYSEQDNPAILGRSPDLSACAGMPAP